MNRFESALGMMRRLNHERYASEEAKIIYAYRYISLALISAAYLINGPDNVLSIKIAVITLLFVSSGYIIDLYVKNSQNRPILMALIVIETIGLGVLLLVTGGLSSPFIWYSTNLTLVAACYLNYYFSWVNLLLFLGTGLLIHFGFYNKSSQSFVELLVLYSNLILVFILISIVVQQLSNLSKKLQVSSREKEKSMDSIMSLYQIVEALNNHSCKDELFDVISAYTATLTQNDFCLIWLREKDRVKSGRDLSDADREKIVAKLKGLEAGKNDITRIISVGDRKILAVPIISSYEFYGFITVDLKEESGSNVVEQYTKLILFIAGLCAVTLERFDLEAIEENLLVLEEQNRIADEIHDSVSQRLFSISYGLHGILGRLDTVHPQEFRAYLEELKQSSNMAMNELRNSIYRLSSKKNGEKYLQNTIQKFLDSISRLYGVKTTFQVAGDEKLLTSQYEQGLIRIIREACTNAIRHGQCRNIVIDLVMYDHVVDLSIEDDGCGFSMEHVGSSGGLGLINMKSLVSSFNGTFNIRSNIGKGTEIQISIPPIPMMK
ncbi:MAG: sensor histidine kinase [Saccharofermentanales bacterium]